MEKLIYSSTKENRPKGQTNFLFFLFLFCAACGYFFLFDITFATFKTEEAPTIKNLLTILVLFIFAIFGTYVGLGVIFGVTSFYVENDNIFSRTSLFGFGIKKIKIANKEEFDEIKIFKSVSVRGDSGVRSFTLGLKGKAFYKDVYSSEDLG